VIVETQVRLEFCVDKSFLINESSLEDSREFHVPSGNASTVRPVGAITKEYAFWGHFCDPRAIRSL
jgi:hypothetical protein